MEDFNQSSLNLSPGGRDGNVTDIVGSEEFEYIFDKPDVQIIFIFLYTIVFCFCFFGNLAVVLVVTLHWRMRSITKFCLGNLAFANLCVGIFCVYQNLSTYLMDRWVFGHFMCKMYHFTNNLSHTASILILVVICVERYLAILHPFRCRRILTIKKLMILILTVWFVSAILSSPRLYYITTYNIPAATQPGEEKYFVEICAPQLNLYDNHTVDMIYSLVLFVFPLTVMSVLYARMGIFLWHSARITKQMLPISSNSNSVNSVPSCSESMSSNINSRRSTLKRQKRQKMKFTRKAQSAAFTSSTNKTKNNCSLDNPNGFSGGANLQNGSACDSASFKKTPLCCNIFSKDKFLANKLNKNLKPDFENAEVEESDFAKNSRLKTQPEQDEEQMFENPEFPAQTFSQETTPSRSPILTNESSVNTTSIKISNNSVRLLEPRRMVVRMLIAIVISFALCNLPFHLRKICQNYMKNYDFGSNFSNLLTPLTFLLMYTNCAINPILYAFMSKSFRASFKDLIKCKLQKKLVIPDSII